MTGQGISTYQDVKVLEAFPLQDRHLPNSILEAIMNGVAFSEGRDALIFLPDATRTSHVFRWTYGELITAIRQTAAGLKTLSAKDLPVISLLLPNLPETHFSLWGGAIRWPGQSHQPPAGARTDRRNHGGRGQRCSGDPCRRAGR